MDTVSSRNEIFRKCQEIIPDWTKLHTKYMDGENIH